jgi:hypothetical protein
MHNEESLTEWPRARVLVEKPPMMLNRNGKQLMGLKLLKDDLTISRREIYRTNAEVVHVKLEGV